MATMNETDTVRLLKLNGYRKFGEVQVKLEMFKRSTDNQTVYVVSGDYVMTRSDLPTVLHEPGRREVIMDCTGETVIKTIEIPKEDQTNEVRG